MGKQDDRTFASPMGAFVRTCTALEILIAFLVVIPLTLWLAWARHSTTAEPVVLTFFCLSFAWLNVSLLRWRRSVRNLGSSSSGKLAFGLGPRPEDLDEVRLWQVGIHLRYSFLAVILTMSAFAITKWLSGE
jgi:hypothetical protein